MRRPHAEEWANNHGSYRIAAIIICPYIVWSAGHNQIQTRSPFPYTALVQTKIGSFCSYLQVIYGEHFAPDLST